MNFGPGSILPRASANPGRARISRAQPVKGFKDFPAGKILVAGSNADSRFLVRLHADGALDISFNAQTDPERPVELHV